MSINAGEIQLRKLYLSLKYKIGYPPARRVMRLLREKADELNKDNLISELRKLELDERQIREVLKTLRELGIMT